VDGLRAGGLLGAGGGLGVPRAPGGDGVPAGAVFGWLLEGVVVGTAYEILPISISFTGLAWHGLISFSFGLWALPEILSRRCNLLFPAVIGIGLFFGAWAINWNANPNEYRASAVEFLIFAAAATALLIPE
jgi:hypothetical protein